MTTPPTAYLATFAATLVGVAALYVGLFFYQLGAPVAAEYWVREVKIAKLFLATHTPGRRVVILGGSNALFGIDSSLIEREIGLPTVNLAIHAGLPLPYIFAYAKPILRPADVVVMPLELEYYVRAYRYDWFRSNVMAWDPAYISTLPLLEQGRFLLEVPAKRVVSGAIARVFETRLRRTHGRLVRDPDLIKREATRIWDTRSYVGKPITYSLWGLDKHGDMQNNRGTRYTGPSASALSSPFEYASELWEDIEGFAAYCRVHRIELFVTWPPIMKDSDLADRNPIVQWNTQQIANRLRSAKISLLGRPQDYYLDRSHFFDTKYHLNEEGRALRTRQLIVDLRNALITGGSAAQR